MRRTTGMLGAGAIAACVLLAGCGGGSTATDRAAAAEESAAPASSAAPQPSSAAPSSAAPSEVASSAPAESATPSDTPAPEESSGNLSDKLGLRVAANAPNAEPAVGSKLCIRNDSSKQVDVGFANLSQGSEQCTEGGSLMGADISVNVQADGTSLMTAQANNPYVGFGWVKLIQPAFGECLYNGLATRNAKSEPKDDGILRYQFLRVTPNMGSSGTGQIEYKLVLSDSKKPSNQPVQCF